VVSRSDATFAVIARSFLKPILPVAGAREF
jgi:hypothetical protein